MKQKILVVEDDLKTAAVIRLYLERAGFEVTGVEDGRLALSSLKSENYSLVLLDVMLPRMNGFDVCLEVRMSSGIPLILLTARTTEEDKLKGLELGADDYISKPFSPRELVARVRAVLRRGVPAANRVADQIQFQDLMMNLENHEVQIQGQTVHLTRIEFKVLEMFMRSPQRIFTRRELVERALGIEYEGLDRTMDAHIRNLRKKIDLDPEADSHITTVFGVGYKLASSK